MLDEYLRWLEHNEGLAVSTVVSYGGYLKRLQVHCADRGTSLLLADRRVLEEFTGPVAHQAGISLSGRRPLIAAVRSFFKWMHDQGKRGDDPAKQVSYPKVGKPLPTKISKHYAEQMLLRCDLATFAGWRDAALLAMLIGLGLRVSGLVGMTSSTLSVERLDNGHDVFFATVTEKGRKERRIPVPEEALWFLLPYLDHPEFKALLPGITLLDGSHLLWVQTNRGSCPAHDWFGEKRRLSTNGVRDIIQRRGQEAGVPDAMLHPHAFRHLYGTELVEHDTDRQKIQMLMGHSSLESSAIYTHLAERKLAEVVANANPLRGMNTRIHAMHSKVKAKPKAVESRGASGLLR